MGLSLESVAIVILNYNGRSFLERFLPGVIAHSEGCQIIVADNRSTDDSLAWMQEHYPGIPLICNDKNTGYAGGYNQALKQVTAEYLILLNSDVEVTPRWVEPVIARMELDPGIAACQPKLRAYHERQDFEYAGAAGGFLDPLGYPFCRGRIFDHVEEDSGQYDVASTIFWASGACLFIRKDAFDQMGGFDEDFFAHMEEIDLCWRLWRSGWSVWYEPESVVYHVGGGTLQATSPFKTYLNFRNNLWLLTKNLPLSQWVWKFPLRLVLDGVAGLQFLASGKGKHCWMIVKAHFDAYRRLPKMFRKRSVKSGKLNLPQEKKWLLKQYFLLKKRTYSAIFS